MFQGKILKVKRSTLQAEEGKRLSIKGLARGRHLTTFNAKRLRSGDNSPHGELNGPCPQHFCPGMQGKGQSLKKNVFFNNS